MLQLDRRGPLDHASISLLSSLAFLLISNEYLVGAYHDFVGWTDDGHLYLLNGSLVHALAHRVEVLVLPLGESDEAMMIALALLLIFAFA